MEKWDFEPTLAAEETVNMISSKSSMTLKPSIMMVSLEGNCGYRNNNLLFLTQLCCWGSMSFLSICSSWWKSVCHVCRFCSVAHWLFDIFASYVALIQPMRAWCGAYYSLVSWSKLKVTWVIEIFSHVHLMAWCLFDRFASNVALIQPMDEWCFVYSFQVNSWKVKVTQVVWIFSQICLCFHFWCFQEAAYRVTYNVKINELLAFAVDPSKSWICNFKLWCI